MIVHHGRAPASREIELTDIETATDSGAAKLNLSEAKLNRSKAEWRERLTPKQYEVTRGHGTERAFTGPYWDNKAAGTYACICCGQPLFDAATKYDSGTGWPSFSAPIAGDAVDEHSDTWLFMRRTEVRCARCDAHLGHVFPDGPRPTGLRYCMNGVALDFRPKTDASGTGSQ